MLAQDCWGNDMSGIEPILIGAAIGGGTSAIMGGDPLQGALLGAAGGGISSGISGLGAASQTAGNVAAAAGTETAKQAATLIPPSAMSTAAGVGGSTPYLVEPSISTFGSGIKAAMENPSALFGDMDMSKMAAMSQMSGGLLGDGRSQQQTVSAPPIRRGQAPQVQAPIDELMRLQMLSQRQRRPFSLL